MAKTLNADWIGWIRTNVEAGRDKDGIFKILLDEGYAYQDIQTHLQHEPSVALDQLVNPFGESKAQAPAQGQQVKEINRSKIFIPNASRLDSGLIELYTIDQFFNACECQLVIDLIRSQKSPSGLSSYEPDASFRTSSTCDLSRVGGAEMRALDERICQMIGIDPSYSEAIQGQYYEIGQEFKAHTDYFEPAEIKQHDGGMGQRTYTFMIYLNDVEEGGETAFPRLGHALTPKAGMAVVWNSLNPDGSTNDNSLHQACPVIKGYKAVITKWFRSGSARRPAPPMFGREINEYIPNYTRTGFQKSRLPDALYQKILQFYRDNTGSQSDEFVDGGYIVSAGDQAQASSTLVDLTPALREEIHDVMKPLLEAWSGQQLEPTYVYGIRIYQNNAVLKSHRDRYDTHIISAIINVDQVVNTDWLLLIDDNDYREHHLVLKPGDMVFYEGGRLLHGRPEPLDGTAFANIFCHFKPAGYVPAV